ncbi:glycoside hydrolase family 3 [Paenibacillus odorifer]|jgi:beta-N-acetylhexosaminidase|uniref:beta-N-acetylhexosaminidase n=1 Tax=Paenibacillus odorifer TaxID=189426 RepID=A0ABX3GK70_9BACL|nr:glycoside hydrolase family 3 protein [Paenibacillus odorifer]OMD19959.1 glycoside hydrolase family 3 [Paenibacillus odorifer]OMD91692.1 glycoside hydrolase family 3 [Paenibacillus odorifer]OME03643.1 glycoside hydrolase family 3 [Paenibacillus odorifer]
MRTIEHMSLREKIGQMFVTGFPSTEITPELKEVIEHYKVGNIILFSHNIDNKYQLGELVTELQQWYTTHTGIPGFITIDQEGGRVTRMPKDATNVAGAMAIASSGRPENAYAAGRMTARELKALGINFNLAPVMDVNNNALNPVINVRSYGDSVATVSQYGIQMMKGLLDGSVMSSLKHFPGHGDTNVDSHIGLPTIEKTLEELEQLELLPFKAAIEQGAQAIMSAHILFPKIEKSGVPGTMSHTIITEILKGKLGYKGLVVSDCLEMDAIKRYYGTAKGALGAVKAGIDLVFISHTPETVKEAIHLIEEAVATGDLDEALIDAAVTKILAYKAQYATIEELDYELVGCDVHRRANELMRTETICLMKGELQPIHTGDEQVLFMGSYSYRTDLASSSLNQALSFPQYMGEHFNTAYEIIDIDPSEEQINAALPKVQGYKHIVIGLFNARENKGQLALVQKLLAAGCKVTAITLGRPYDLPLIEGEFCGIAAFEYTLDAFKSLLPILNGEVVPTAKITIQM